MKSKPNLLTKFLFAFVAIGALIFDAAIVAILLIGLSRVVGWVLSILLVSAGVVILLGVTVAAIAHTINTSFELSDEDVNHLSMI